MTFTIQEGVAANWRRVVDTGMDNPDDIAEPGNEQVLQNLQYRVKARSVVVLIRA